MEMHADEAYYHLYGQFLAWGYFDHPPMVGLMAWLSNLLMGHTTVWGLHNLTVRLMTILMHSLTLLLVWRITVENRPQTKQLTLTFFMVAAGLVMFSTAGFMLTPDSPLLLFVALFYYAYQQYLKGQNPWCWAMLLGIAIAGMIYSKYMGVLVVAFTVLSNLRLTKDGHLWCALLLALALLMPHFWWQYSHDFPSFQYHLIGRNTGFAVGSILEYWPNQLVVFNPLAIVIMLWVGWQAIRRREQNRFEGALGTTIWGFLFFFWLMTLKGHAEPHWTMAISVPAIILLTRYIAQGEKTWLQQKWVHVVLWIMVGICLVARGVLCANVLPFSSGLAQKRSYFDATHQLCGDRVMVQPGSFQDPSLYRFWEGESVLMHDINERHTQFELLDVVHMHQGDTACIITWGAATPDTVIDGYAFTYRMVEHLQLTDRIQCQVQQLAEQGDSLYGTVSVYNPYPVEFLWQHTEMPVQPVLAYIQDNQWAFSSCLLEGPERIPSQTEVVYQLKAAAIHQPFVLALGNGVVVTSNSPMNDIKQ